MRKKSARNIVRWNQQHQFEKLKKQLETEGVTVETVDELLDYLLLSQLDKCVNPDLPHFIPLFSDTFLNTLVKWVKDREDSKKGQSNFEVSAGRLMELKKHAESLTDPSDSTPK